MRTNYTGATPDTIDKEVTSVIEGAVARTPGVVSISSSSSAGQSQVTIEFDQKTDINVAANDLRDAIGNLRSLPTDDNFKPPTIVKADANADAIMRLAATSSTMSIQDLTQVVNDVIVTRLAAVDGVADVQVFGDRNPLVQIIIDPNALAAHGLTVADLNSALGNVTLDAPAGNDFGRQPHAARARRRQRQVGRRDRQHPDQPADQGVATSPMWSSARPTRPPRCASTARPASASASCVRPRANTLDISAGVRKAIAEMKSSLPPGVDLTITSDDAEFISGAIHEVLLTLVIATAIVIAIIYLFLQSLRVTFIPAVTVPIALIGTLAAMWVVGFSINVLTLLALVLATGLVVDDAIVVIENISRQRGLGLGPRAAAVLGTRQVFFAVLATTATLAAVFIPISFFPGLTGSLFSEFGFVLAFAVTLSCFVALTLSPMLASRLISDRQAHHQPQRRSAAASPPSASASSTLYARLLDAALKAPMVVIVAALLFAGAAAGRLQSAAFGADAERGPRLHSDLGFGAAGLDRRLHRSADEAGRADRRAAAQERRGYQPVCHRARRRQWRLHVPDAGAVGRALAHPGRDHRRAEPRAAARFRASRSSPARPTASASAAAGRACSSPSPAPTTTSSPASPTS